MQLNRDHVVYGVREVLRAIDKNRVSHVFVANDADDFVVSEILTRCEEQAIPVDRTKTRTSLGSLCKLKVKTAAAAILHEHR